MKVLLLNPPFYSKSGARFNRSARWPSTSHSDVVCYPIYLSWATGWLEKNGVECKLVDAIARRLTLEDVIGICVGFQPDIIVEDTSLPSIYQDAETAKALAPYCFKMVMVGTFASALPNETLELSGADYVVRGEYDIALANLALKEPLLHQLGANRKIIQGTPFIEMDELPFNSQIYGKHLRIEDYFYSLARYPEVQIQGSRGCYYSCNYCTQPQVLTNHSVRWRSASNLVDELEWIRDNLKQVKDIALEDDAFTSNEKRTLEFCREIEARHLDVSWIVESRVTTSLELLKAMKRAGCKMFIVGFESGSQKVLDLAHKGTTVEQAVRFSENAKVAGIKVMGCFMLGLLGETKETMRETFALAKKVNPDFYFFASAIPFAGTEFYDICRKEGYLTAEDWGDWLDGEGYSRNVVSYPGLSSEEIADTMNNFYLRFALRPSFLLKSFRNFLDQPDSYIRAFKEGLRYFTHKK